MSKNLILSNYINQSTRKDLFLYIFLWSLAFLSFFKGWDAGWTYDSIRFSFYVKKYSLPGLLGQHIDHSLQYLYYSVYYLLDSSFGPKGWGWYLLKISIHSLNAFLIFRLCKYLLYYYNDLEGTKIPLLASILFLLAPSASEVVLYQAAIHFMFSTCLLLSCFLLLLESFRLESLSKTIAFYILFIAALFTLEIAYTFGIASALLILFLPGKYLENKKSFYFKYSAIPVLLVLIYLILNKMILHDFIGHYGRGKHFQFIFDNIIQNITKIPLDFVGLIEYWSIDQINKVYNLLYHHYFTVALCSVYATAYLYLLYTLYKDPLKNKLLFLSVNLVLLLALPTINLGILYIFPIEEDRYSYYISGFVFLLILQLFYKLSKTSIYTVSLVIGLTGFIGLQKNCYNWSITQKVIDNSLKSFPYVPGKRYMILASPVYANGVLIWDRQESKEDPFADKYQLIAKGLYVQKELDVFNKIGSVLQYNIINEHESPLIEKIDSNTLRMTLPCCGKWWWKFDRGATNFENAYYTIKMIGGWQQEVRITFKQKPADMIYLYQCGDHFCRFDF